MIELANGNGHAEDYAEALASIQYKLTKRIGRRAKVKTVAAYLGYESAGAVSGWLNGTRVPTHKRAQHRIRRLAEALAGNVEFPTGINPADPAPATMIAWHEEAWAAEAARTRDEKAVVAPSTAPASRHILKALDQNGEVLDRIERKVDALAEAVKFLLSEWRTPK